ncbi:MAG TPA: hypothetical protein VK050_00370 [Flavobacteriaceae bacterium]|nr:hypothetical protein [Flavobacteriaceae bacterium]
MKVLKYLIYLILLLLIGGAILISTDKGQYKVTKEITLNAPKEMVYDVFKNWEHWQSWHKRWTDDKTTSLDSQGNSLVWASNNKMYEKGEATFTKNIPYKTLEFDTDIKTNLGTMTQQNKINLTGLGELSTEVKWESSVTLSFWQKLAVRLGKGDKYIQSESDLFVSSLLMLDSKLVEKMNLRNAEVLGLTILPKRNHIHTATASNKENFIATARKKIDQLYSYTKEYGIPINGDPLVVIHKRENNNQNFLFSVALPLIDGYELNLENPEIVIGVFKSRSTLKTSLKGNYKYWEEALELGIEYIKQQQLESPLEEGIVLKWVNYKDLPVNPAEWVTEVYIPAYE